MKAVYVSLTIDDLDARDDPKRSDMVGTYDCTQDEIAQVMKIIKNHKGKHQNTVGFPIEDSLIEIIKGK